jgi:hypothetical protein
MSKANAWGLPGALGKLAEILEAPEQKDKAGGALITKLCCPRNPTKKDPRRRIQLKKIRAVDLRLQTLH